MHLEPSISGHVYRRKGPRADVWYAKWRGADGRQHKRRLGPAWRGRGRPAAGYLTKRLAEDELRRILDEEDHGVGLAAPARDVTLAEAAEEWLRYVEFDRACKPSTLVDYRSTLSRYVLPHLAEARLLELTPQTVERWRARLTHGPKRPLSNRTRNKALTVLHGVLERARVVYALPTNPAADVEKLREQIDPTRFPAYTPEEVHARARGRRRPGRRHLPCRRVYRIATPLPAERGRRSTHTRPAGLTRHSGISICSSGGSFRPASC